MAKSKVIEYLLVDGYNIIFAWDNLKILAESSLDHARIKLINILSNFQGYTGQNIIVVFDAHKVNNGKGSIETYNNITVVYTKEKETADNYIERTAKTLSKKYKIKVATSDALEQIIIMGTGALRVSAKGLYREIQESKKEITKTYIQDRPVKNNMLIENLDEETAKILENMRMSKGRE